MISRTTIKKLFFLGCIVVATQAQALVVLQQVIVPFGVEYDSNTQLSPDNKQSIWRYTSTPTYTISAVDGQNRWFSSFGLRLQRSSNKEISVDREDPVLAVGWERELERGSFKLFGNYEKNSIRAVELKRTGLINSDGDQTTKSINAEWSRLLTERLTFTLGGKLLKTLYSVGDNVDYTNYGLDSTLGYKLNEKINTFVKITYLKYKPDDNFEDINSQNYTGGVNIEVSPSLSFSASAGWNHLSTAGNTFIASTGFKYSVDRHAVNGVLERFVDAGNGDSQRSERFVLAYLYQISDKSKIGSNFSFQKNSFLATNQATGPLGDNKIMNLGAIYTRDISERWAMNLTAGFIRQKVSNQNAANAEIAGISFVYNTPQF